DTDRHDPEGDEHLGLHPLEGDDPGRRAVRELDLAAERVGDRDRSARLCRGLVAAGGVVVLARPARGEREQEGDEERKGGTSCHRGPSVYGWWDQTSWRSRVVCRPTGWR